MYRLVNLPNNVPAEYAENLLNRIITEQMAFDMLATLGKYEAIARKSSHDESRAKLERDICSYAAEHLRKLRIHSEQSIRKPLHFPIELACTNKGRYFKLCHLDGRCHYSPLSDKEYIVLRRKMKCNEPAKLIENPTSEPVIEIGIDFIEKTLELLTGSTMFAVIDENGNCFMRNVPVEFRESIPLAKTAALENARYRIER